MADMNSIAITGRLGRDFEVRNTPNGHTVATTAIAVNVGKQDDPPIWLEITIWGKQAERVGEFFQKGSRIGVVGQIYQDKWQDKNTQQERTKMGVNVDRWSFVDSKQDGNDGYRGAQQAAARPEGGDRGGAPATQQTTNQRVYDPSTATSTTYDHADDIPF